MKKIVFICTIASLYSAIAVAQNKTIEPSVSPWAFGIHAGVTAGAPFPKTVAEGAKGDLGTGFRGGFLLKRQLGSKFSLLNEWSYANKKAAFSSPVKDQYIEQTFQIPDGTGGFVTGKIETTFSGNTSGTFDLHYLEMQLMGEYQLSKRLAVAVGGYGADMLAGTNTGIATDVHIGTVQDKFPDQPFDNSAELNRFDYGLAGGMRFEYAKRMGINARLAYGMAPLYKATFTRVDDKLAMRYVQVGFDYRLQP